MKEIFGKEKNIVIGMIHIYPTAEQVALALGYDSLNKDQLTQVSEFGTETMSEKGILEIETSLIDLAVKDAFILDSVGVDGLIIENYDFGYIALSPEEKSAGLVVPYKTHNHVVKLIEKTIHAVKEVTNKPIGINILTHDPKTNLEVADKNGCQFIQLDSVIGSYVGRKETSPEAMAELKQKYSSVKVLGGVHPKYYERAIKIPDDVNSKEDLKDLFVKKDLLNLIDKTTEYSLVDMVVLTGDISGGHPPKNLKFVRDERPDLFIIAGSGVKVENVETQLKYANGLIVGSAFKEGGLQRGTPVSYGLSKKFMEAVYNSKQT